jgi:hypothetical protein
MLDPVGVIPTVHTDTDTDTDTGILTIGGLCPIAPGYCLIKTHLNLWYRGISQLQISRHRGIRQGLGSNLAQS